MMEKQYQQSTQDLAAAAQNPIAAMISLPLQNNIYGEVGPNHNATGKMLNIQPVIPITLDDWNIISRTIAPADLSTRPCIPYHPKPWSLASSVAPISALAISTNGVTYYSFGGAFYRPYYSGSRTSTKWWRTPRDPARVRARESM
jgi:hypothetical protein